MLNQIIHSDLREDKQVHSFIKKKKDLMFAQRRELTKLTANDNLNVDIKHIA